MDEIVRYCRKCGTRKTFTHDNGAPRRYIEPEDACVNDDCKATMQWSTEPIPPPAKWELTYDDWVYLKCERILAD